MSCAKCYMCWPRTVNSTAYVAVLSTSSFVLIASLQLFDAQWTLCACVEQVIFIVGPSPHLWLAFHKMQ